MKKSELKQIIREQIQEVLIEVRKSKKLDPNAGKKFTVNGRNFTVVDIEDEHVKVKDDQNNTTQFSMRYLKDNGITFEPELIAKERIK